MPKIKSEAILDIPYKGKLFAMPQVHFIWEHQIPSGITDEHDKAIKLIYEKIWTKKFEKLQKEREKAIGKAMEDTEAMILKKPPADMQVFVANANKAIEMAVVNWADVLIPKLAEEAVNETALILESKLRGKLSNEKIKVVAKTVALSVLTLTGAGLAIATAVVTGGLAFPIIGAIASVGGAILGVVTLAKKQYEAYQGYLDKIEKGIAELNKAIDYQIKKETAAKFRDLGPKEKAKLLMGGCGPLVKNLKADIAAAGDRLVGMNQEFKKVAANAEEAQAKLDELMKTPVKALTEEGKKAKAMAGQTAREVDKIYEANARFQELKKAAEAEMERLEKEGQWDGGKISKLVAGAGRYEKEIDAVFSAAKSIMAAGPKLKAALEAAGKI